MDTLIIIVIIYCSINYIIFRISLGFLFYKAKINWKYALIPFVSLYYFMKLCKINPIWIFIPGFNIIVFVVSPIIVGYHFNQPYWFRFMGMFIPFIFYPYVAYKGKYIHRKLSNLNLQSIYDIDKLENKIKKDVEYYGDSDNQELTKNRKRNKNDEKNQKLNFVDILDTQLKNAPLNDIIVTDEDLTSIVDPTIEQNKIIQNSEFLLEDDTYDNNLNSNEIFEDISSEDTSMDLKELSIIEDKSIDSNNKEYIDDSNYTELEDNKKDLESIAFNTDKQKDNNKISILESKSISTDLKCPRCGSSLIGANDSCPGCGANIKELLK